MPASPAAEGKFKELCGNLGINQASWNLDSWNEESIAAREEFYFKYVEYIIKTVAN